MIPAAFFDQPALDNRATRYLRDRPCGAWTARTIAEAIRATPPAVESMLAEAVRVGAVARISDGPRCPAHYHWAGAQPEQAAPALQLLDGEEEDLCDPPPSLTPLATGTAGDWTAALLPGGAIELRAGQGAQLLTREQVRALVLCLDGEDLQAIREGA